MPIFLHLLYVYLWLRVLRVIGLDILFFRPGRLIRPENAPRHIVPGHQQPDYEPVLHWLHDGILFSRGIRRIE